MMSWFKKLTKRDGPPQDTGRLPLDSSAMRPPDAPASVELRRYTGRPGSGTFTDSRDGKVYRTQRIGQQTWLAENLAYLPHVSPGPEQGGIWVYAYEGSDVEDARAAENFALFGCLYDWDKAMEASPAGWHLPNEEEWQELARYFGGSSEDGNTMKDADSGLWVNCHFNANNSSGFSALPGGARSPAGQFFGLGVEASFWSSSEWAGGKFWHRYLENVSPYVRTNPNERTWGFSVRCVKDAPTT